MECDGITENAYVCNRIIAYSGLGIARARSVFCQVYLFDNEIRTLDRPFEGLSPYICYVCSRKSCEDLCILRFGEILLRKKNHKAVINHLRIYVGGIFLKTLRALAES